MKKLEKYEADLKGENLECGREGVEDGGRGVDGHGRERLGNISFIRFSSVKSTNTRSRSRRNRNWLIKSNLLKNPFLATKATFCLNTFLLRSRQGEGGEEGEVNLWVCLFFPFGLLR